MAIISGIGVREYYAKRGYHLDGTYMIKNLYTIRDFMIVTFVASLWILYLSIYCNVAVFTFSFLVKQE